MPKYVLLCSIVLGIFLTVAGDSAQSCGHPGYVLNGRRIGNPFTYANKVEFECREGYKLRGLKTRYCEASGKWSGELPICEPIYCPVPTNPVNGQVWASSLDYGTELHYKCNEGFVLQNHKPRHCTENGTWSNNEPVCVGNCAIPFLYNGDIKEERLGDFNFNWRKLQYIRTVNYIKIPAGTVPPPASSLTVFCDNGYSFQGTTEVKKGITCVKGKWLPDPVCLLVGTKYVPTTTTRRFRRVTTPLPTARVKSEPVPVKTTPVSMIPTPTTTVESGVVTLDGVSPVDGEIPNIETEPRKEECYCKYPINDENLRAYADGKRLKFHDKVKDGSMVLVRCGRVRFHRLTGARRIKCEECRNWLASEFPTCIDSESATKCSINTLKISVPKGVAADLSEVTGEFQAVGSKVRLQCEENLILTGTSEATCDLRGKWDYGNVQCITGCRLNKDVSSSLNIHPVKEYYQFGEFVLLSCPPGQKLSSETERLMCLSGSWSDIVPDCI